MELVDIARLYALAAIARNDSLIAIFEAKYKYEFWRPVTAIRNADIDNNEKTEAQASWQPIDVTPLHPEYPCAHCILAASLAGVVETVTGTKSIPNVLMTSPTAPGVTRSWKDLDSFVKEVSEARIWAGFHYRFSTTVGEKMGYGIS